MVVRAALHTRCVLEGVLGATRPDLGRRSGIDSCGRMEPNLSSPNLAGVDRFGFATERIEKPWGYELLWALTDRYCGKLIFVRAGHALSLQFHKVKDEAWYVESGRAELELAGPGEGITESE